MSLKRLNFRQCLISIIICFLFGFICAAPPLFGWSYFSMEGALTSCSVEWAERSTNVISYNIFIFIVSFFGPLVIISYTNIKLLQIVSNFEAYILILTCFLYFFINLFSKLGKKCG